MRSSSFVPCGTLAVFWDILVVITGGDREVAEQGCGLTSSPASAWFPQGLWSPAYTTDVVPLGARRDWGMSSVIGWASWVEVGVGFWPLEQDGFCWLQFSGTAMRHQQSIQPLREAGYIPPMNGSGQGTKSVGDRWGNCSFSFAIFSLKFSIFFNYGNWQ